MSITHHLDEATLMSFAAGALPAAFAAVAASHLAMCPRCRGEAAALERVGGALMATLEPATLDRPELLPPEPATVRSPPQQRALARDREVPRPIAGLVADGLDAVAWRWIGPGVWDHNLPLTGAGKLRLLKVASGRNVPEHGHGGAELTLVLRGSFHDETGRYRRGDVSDLDEEVAHQPVADSAGDCICLIASEAPEQFHGLVARNWQRVRRF
jgi:putative transcriptional regulator